MLTKIFNNFFDINYEIIDFRTIIIAFLIKEFVLYIEYCKFIENDVFENEQTTINRIVQFVLIRVNIFNKFAFNDFI